ncbi:Cytochrome b-c1 complex subunit 6 [Umbelopsis nana]
MALADLLSSFLPTVYAEEEQPEEQPEEVVAVEVEEEEEEPEDPKDAIMEECANTKECSQLKHHLDECAERVENGSHEDCIEEFFHFMHCADACAAPKLFEATV